MPIPWILPFVFGGLSSLRGANREASILRRRSGLFAHRASDAGGGSSNGTPHDFFKPRVLVANLRYTRWPQHVAAASAVRCSREMQHASLIPPPPRLAHPNADEGSSVRVRRHIVHDASCAGLRSRPDASERADTFRRDIENSASRVRRLALRRSAPLRRTLAPQAAPLRRVRSLITWSSVLFSRLLCLREGYAACPSGRCFHFGKRRLDKNITTSGERMRLVPLSSLCRKHAVLTPAQSSVIKSLRPPMTGRTRVGDCSAPPPISRF